MGIVSQDITQIADEELGSEEVSRIEEDARGGKNLDEAYQGNPLAELLYENARDVSRYAEYL